MSIFLEHEAVSLHENRRAQIWLVTAYYVDSCITIQASNQLLCWRSQNYVHLHESIVGQAVKEAFGYHEPTKSQVEAIHHLSKGEDVFICLSIGSGKSLCYASLPLILTKSPAVLSTQCFPTAAKLTWHNKNGQPSLLLIWSHVFMLEEWLIADLKCKEINMPSLKACIEGVLWEWDYNSISHQPPTSFVRYPYGLSFLNGSLFANTKPSRIQITRIK